MDGIHDFGGKEGYGPIDVNEPEEQFHEDWEARIWAMTRVAGAPGVTIDWWRHMREAMDPARYLTDAYFDQWTQNHLASFINAGVISFEELKGGKCEPVDPALAAKIKKPPTTVLSKQQALETAAEVAFNFEVGSKEPPAFAVGDHVMTKSMGNPHHTRLPAYARGRPGIIHAHHGAHLFPDEGAKGNHVGQHLYTVAFEAADLWPEAAGRRDRVFLDLWESYFETA